MRDENESIRNRPCRLRSQPEKHVEERFNPLSGPTEFPPPDGTLRSIAAAWWGQAQRDETSARLDHRPVPKPCYIVVGTQAPEIAATEPPQSLFSLSPLVNKLELKSSRRSTAIESGGGKPIAPKTTGQWLYRRRATHAGLSERPRRWQLRQCHPVRASCPPECHGRHVFRLPCVGPWVGCRFPASSR